MMSITTTLIFRNFDNVVIALTVNELTVRVDTHIQWALVCHNLHRLSP